MFLQSSALNLTALPASSQQPSSPVEPHRFLAPQQLSEHLFVFEDTCNVYLLRQGRRGLLIDFGSGGILPYLPGLGVERVDWILHTHHHRDQAQGDGKAVLRKIPIAVPRHERQYFEDAQNFWRNRRIVELYDVQNDFFCLTENIPVAQLLDDYTTFHWGQHSFFVQPTPGHTQGSITLLTTIDETKVAFSGDLIHSAGKVQTLYDLQYSYGEHEGVDLSIYSLTELMLLKPGLLCPSHGQPFSDPVPAMKELSDKLREWHRFWYKHPPTADLEPVAITPHLIACTETTCSLYAIISASGKALFLDYGGASWTFFQVFTRHIDTFGRMRFVEHSIRKLQERHGLLSIDVAIPSHMHDDHLNGFPYLVGRYGTKIWAHECMKDILQRPRDLNVGCIFGDPIQIDRVLKDRETFRWEEFEFTVVHSPGHTNYEMAMFTTIDGHRVAFTGDAFFSDSEHPQSLRHNLIYRNQVRVGDYLKATENLIAFQPDLIAPGHGKPFPVTRENAIRFSQRARQQDDLFRTLIASRNTDLGLDPSWLRMVPYQVRALAGEPCTVTVQLRNLTAEPIDLVATPVTPPGWNCSPSQVRLQAPANRFTTAAFQISVPASQGLRSPSRAESRHAIALDVTCNGKYLGQIAEAVVDVT